MTELSEISRDLVRERIAESLRARIGQGRKFSVAQVAAQSGIGVTTIKGYLGALAEPTLSQFIKLAAVLGPVFASEITAIINFDVIHCSPETVDTIDLLASAAAMVSSATTAMRAPKRITHTVDREIQPFVEDVVTAGQCWLAARNRVAFSRGDAAADTNDRPPSLWARLQDWYALRAWVAGE